MGSVTFQEIEEKDIATILDIYNHYIFNSTTTFDIGPILREEFLQRIPFGHERYRTYLILDSGETAGFCFLNQFKRKKAYDRTAEIGLYFKPEFTGKGLGRKAINFLETSAADKGIKVLIASISGENTASIKLFERAGYEKCAHYREVGEKFDRIIDVVDYQKILPN